jgi:RimJ/RimL family protein N-acetyltransferase
MNSRNEESGSVEIVDFLPKYRDSFRELNEQWLTKFFEIEPFDRILLNNPETQILDRGGAVLFARKGNRIVGTCALLRQTDFKFELCKVTVAEDARGQGIATMMVKTALERAREMGALRIVLALSDIFPDANHLCRKFGFEQIDPIEIGPLPYKRPTIVMALDLEDPGEGE